jgi:glycerol-3-phosphate O-acyltransferase
MDGLSLKERYGELFEKLKQHASTSNVIDETNVYQEMNPYARAILNGIVRENLLAGSRLEGRENFKEFFEQISAGKHGLILSEHYSNLDLPCIVYLLENDKSDFGSALGAGVVAIAGMKLNENDYRIKAFAEAYTRIVIYPQSSLSAAAAKEAQEAEEMRGRKINMAAMRVLDRVRKENRPVLVFPTGTRYRAGKPETKRGLRGIDSYLRLFDVMILISINGQCLRFDPENPEDMICDQMFADKVIAAASPVINCKNFRAAAFAEAAGNAEIDPKQYTVDTIMRQLEAQHEVYEKVRLEGESA